MTRMRLDDDDRDRLRALHPLLSPYFAPIVEDALLGIPESERERLRGPLVAWMSTRLVAREPIAIELGLCVSDVFAVVASIRKAYIERIIQLEPCERVGASIATINKLLDLELATMVHADQRSAIKALSSGLAHELRNPLNSAQLQLDVLVRRLRRRVKDADIVEPAELAQHEIQRLTHLVRDFLQYAQPATLTMAVTDLGTIIEHVVELERALADERGVEMVLAPSPQRVYARVDPEKVHQVIENLVRNALEAAPRGGRVEVALAVDHERIHMSVGDDGPGIPEAVRTRIYEPFFSTKENGTGLGMSIVKSLVALHGGTIDVASTSSGTRFDISLPRAA